MNTTDFAKFDRKQLAQATALLTAYAHHGTPENFYEDGVQVIMDFDSGEVYLTNSAGELAQVIDGKLCRLIEA